MDKKQELVLKAEKIDLSAGNLRRMLRHAGVPFRIILYSDLSHIQNMNDLWRGAKAVIILLQIQGDGGSPVGHWIALLNKESFIEHFDSYGIGIDEELALTHEEPFLKRLLKASQVPVKETKTRLQKFKDHVNTCGRWVVARVLNFQASFDKFKQFYTDQGLSPDYVVTLQTMHL